MQARDGDDQRSEAQPSDGGRNPERGSLEEALAVVYQMLANKTNRPVRVAEPGQPATLTATLVGRGEAKA